MPAVAVIVPARNAEPWISRLMASIRLQTFRDLEVVVVDDASTDGTAESFVRHAGSTRVRIIRNQVRAGVAAARNLAIRSTDCRWVAAVDADDWIHPERIEHLVATAAASAAEWVADQQLWVAGEPPRPLRALLGRRGMPLEQSSFAQRLLLQCGVQGRDCGNLATLQPLVARAAMERNALWYDESLRWCEDLEWSLRCALAGLRLGWSAHADYYYCQTPTASSQYGDRSALMIHAHEAIQASAAASPYLQSAVARRTRDVERSSAFLQAAAGGRHALRSLHPATLAWNLWWRLRNKARLAMLLPSSEQRSRFDGAWRAVQLEMQS
ncbi:MAG TPA: glycosyltransferase [Candidatus Binatia bacterium]|nr:glycosyltransferase [Candidatus Binatia bacterium]